MIRKTIFSTKISAPKYGFPAPFEKTMYPMRPIRKKTHAAKARKKPVRLEKSSTFFITIDAIIAANTKRDESAI